MKSLIFTLFMTGTVANAAGLSVGDWREDLRLALGKGDRKAVTKLTDLEALSKSALARDDQDREIMKKARAHFDASRFDAALKAYDTVPKDSDYWLEAMEEKGWSHLRKGSASKALAQTKSILSPAFLPVVGAEPFFLHALTQLKICDYKQVLETNKLFKDSQKTRVMTLQELASTGANKATAAVVAKADRFPLKFQDFGEEAKTLPRLFHRDRELQKALLAVKLGEAVKTLKAEGMASDRFARIEKAEREGRETMNKRFRALAKAETEENFAMIQKLNLIEVETVQRLHTDRELDRASFAKGRFREVGADELVFPDDGHPWMDELDKFEVQADVCPQNLRRRM